MPEAQLGDTSIAAQKKYKIDQKEINPATGGAGEKKGAVLGETVIAARKRYHIDQSENVVPGSATPSDVRVVKNQ